VETQLPERDNPVTVPSASAKHYTGAEGRLYHEQKRGVPEASVPWIARLRAEKIQPWVRSGDVVFEYGVGSGWNFLALECREKHGFDISEHVREKIERAGISFVPDVAQLPNERVDVVICHHTLEHLPNPNRALAEMRRILKAQGRLLLFVPFEKERRYRKFDPAEPNHHLFSWNVQTLGNLVTDSGFEVLESMVGQFGYDRFAAAQAIRFRVGENGFRLIRSLAHLFRPGLEVRVSARKSPP
jgi:ubiquinone/menaquinone biosynthesis C-methylase UbiE